MLRSNIVTIEIMVTLMIRGKIRSTSCCSYNKKDSLVAWMGVTVLMGNCRVPCWIVLLTAWRVVFALTIVLSLSCSCVVLNRVVFGVLVVRIGIALCSEVVWFSWNSAYLVWFVSCSSVAYRGRSCVR